MLLLRKSTAVTVSFGPAVSNTDGVTLVTNLTGTGANQTENTTTGIRISKNGAAFAARNATAGASTYDAFGNYLVPLDATDTGTLGTLRMQYANAAAFCPIFVDMMVVNTALWDALFASTGGAIPNAAADAAGGLPISDAGGLDLDAQRSDVAAILVDTGTTLDGRIPAALVGGRMDASVGAMAANTLTASAIAADAGAEIADATLDRDMSAGTDSGSPTVRTLRQAVRFLRNKWTVAAGTLTVYKEDDTSASWTGAVSTDAAAVPIIGNDPAS